MARLRDVGERRVLRRLQEILSRQWRCSLLGPGDDAVCVGGEAGNIVAKIDGGSIASSLAPWMSYRDLGWVWVTATASDLVAKAAKPLLFLVSVGLSPDLDEEALYELVEGAAEAAQAHGAWLGGGDTNSSQGPGWVDVAGIGRAVATPPGRQARPGDAVYVTLGRLGLSGAVLYSLQKNTWRSDAAEFPKAFQEFTRPIARLGFLELYKRIGPRCITAALDISDGLAEALYQLSESTGHAIAIEALPQVRLAREFAEKHGVDYKRLLLYGGQEYELVFTVKQDCLQLVDDMLEHCGLEAARLGYVAREAGVLVTLHGHPLERAGWDNFLSAST